MISSLQHGWLLHDGVVVASALRDRSSRLGLRVARVPCGDQVAVMARPVLLAGSLGAHGAVDLAILDASGAVTSIKRVAPWRLVLLPVDRPQIVVAPPGTFDRARVGLGALLEFREAS